MDSTALLVDAVLLGRSGVCSVGTVRAVYAAAFSR